jgi:hypothetical protein
MATPSQGRVQITQELLTCPSTPAMRDNSDCLTTSSVVCSSERPRCAAGGLRLLLLPSEDWATWLPGRVLVQEPGALNAPGQPTWTMPL